MGKGTHTVEQFKEKIGQHRNNWNNCTLCPLGDIAYRHVLWKSWKKRPLTPPVNLFLIGEAPGPMEDSVGIPFIGEAGGILDWELEKALKPWSRRKITVVITNILACIPKPQKGEPKYGDNFRPPKASEAKQCRPRLHELFELMKPKGVVYLGKVAKREAKLPQPIPPTIELNTHLL